MAATTVASLVAAAAIFAVGGYYAGNAYAWYSPAPAPSGSTMPRPALVAVYWSGDMGMRLGSGGPIVAALSARGIPVLAVSSPVLFGKPRDRAFVDAVVARSVRDALRRSGADRVAVIGGSFGADIIGTGLGRLPADLRRRVASVTMLVPERHVYFRANPMGYSYRGPVASEPVHTIPLLRGLPLTCIYGTRESDSLCPEAVMATARRVGIADSHIMLWRRDQAAASVVAAVMQPPSPFR